MIKSGLPAGSGTSHLAGLAGISTPELITNSATCINHCLEVLRNDKKFIFEGSRLATKAILIYETDTRKSNEGKLRKRTTAPRS